MVVNRDFDPPVHQPLDDQRLYAGPLAAGQSAPYAGHVHGRTELDRLVRQPPQRRVDRLVAHGDTLAAGPDPAPADHVGHPDVRLDLGSPPMSLQTWAITFTPFTDGTVASPRMYLISDMTPP